MRSWIRALQSVSDIAHMVGYGTLFSPAAPLSQTIIGSKVNKPSTIANLRHHTLSRFADVAFARNQQTSLKFLDLGLCFLSFLQLSFFIVPLVWLSSCASAFMPEATRLLLKSRSDRKRHDILPVGIILRSPTRHFFHFSFASGNSCTTSLSHH